MTDQATEDFRAGYEAGRRDAIDCALWQIVLDEEVPDWRSHNGAIRLAVIAIRAMVVKEKTNAG